MRIAPLNRPDMEKNHARAASQRKKLTDANPGVQRPFNVEVVLDLGNIVFFHFRGRAYGMPPLPWREGQKLLAAFLDARSIPPILTPETAPAYYKALAKMPHIIWRNCFPASKFMRVLRWLGLAKNPFRYATEQEIMEYAAFFLARRMRSGESGPRVMTPAPLVLAETR